jgi:low affinity Fe/Cu permease
MSAGHPFTRFASASAKVVGRSYVFIACVAVVVFWGFLGPIFHFSDSWQLVINTGTSILTFLMVFIIQNTQNRDNAATQAKLDEIILSSAAENRFIGIEHLSDDELEEMLGQVEKYAQKLQDERRDRRARGL